MRKQSTYLVPARSFGSLVVGVVVRQCFVYSCCSCIRNRPKISLLPGSPHPYQHHTYDKCAPGEENSTPHTEGGLPSCTQGICCQTAKGLRPLCKKNHCNPFFLHCFLCSHHCFVSAVFCPRERSSAQNSSWSPNNGLPVQNKYNAVPSILYTGIDVIQ